MLEGFISFRSPDMGDFRSKIEGAGRDAEVPNELIQRIVRFVHGSSHRDDPNPSATVESVSIPDELYHVLRFIHSCDRTHFNRMCTAVDVDLGHHSATWTSTPTAPRPDRVSVKIPGGRQARDRDASVTIPPATLPLE